MTGPHLHPVAMANTADPSRDTNYRQIDKWFLRRKFRDPPPLSATTQPPASTQNSATPNSTLLLTSHSMISPAIRMRIPVGHHCHHHRRRSNRRKLYSPGFGEIPTGKFMHQDLLPPRSHRPIDRPRSQCPTIAASSAHADRAMAHLDPSPLHARCEPSWVGDCSFQ